MEKCFTITESTAPTSPLVYANQIKVVSMFLENKTFPGFRIFHHIAKIVR